MEPRTAAREPRRLYDLLSRFRGAVLAGCRSRRRFVVARGRVRRPGISCRLQGRLVVPLGVGIGGAPSCSGVIWFIAGSSSSGSGSVYSAQPTISSGDSLSCAVVSSGPSRSSFRGILSLPPLWRSGPEREQGCQLLWLQEEIDLFVVRVADDRPSVPAGLVSEIRPVVVHDHLPDSVGAMPLQQVAVHSSIFWGDISFLLRVLPSLPGSL